MTRLLAVVVGCDYTSGRPNVPALLGAEADARALATRLAGDGLAGGRLVRLTLLLGAEAGTAGIREAVQAARAAQAPDDSLLVYFAGHGLRDASGLILYTADSTYPVADLLADLGPGPERRAVVLDCCHAGAIESAARGAP